MFKCPKCGQEGTPHDIDKHICVDCANAENNRITYYRQHQNNWMEEAKENCIDVWLQQPGETQWEYTVWVAYRDSYPGKKPTYGGVATQLETTTNVVKKIAQRWSFPMRMQAWMKRCDDITLQQRHEEILSMNKEHIDMAAKIRGKLNVAIDHIDPRSMKPAELATLMKMATDLERKARVDTVAQEQLVSDMMHETENPELSKKVTKASDLGEIAEILLKAGAFGEVGIRTTQEVIVRKDGNNDELA